MSYIGNVTNSYGWKTFCNISGLYKKNAIFKQLLKCQEDLTRRGIEELNLD